MKLKMLLRAENAADLRNKVNMTIADGFDIQTNVFVDPDTNLLCQWMAPRYSRYEYRLIEAENLERFEMHVHGLTVFGFDFMFSSVLWDGKYLQWMHRICGDEKFIVKAEPSFALLDNGAVDPEIRANELQLVEGVQVALRMAPVGFAFSSSSIPFPLV